MKRNLLLLFIAIIGIISCAKKMDPVVPVPPEVLKSITLSKDSLDMFVGDTKQLIFTLTPSDFTVKSLVFSSSDSTTVSVSNVGLLTAKKPGLIVITVASQTNTISVNCLVTVALKPVIPPVDSLKVGLLAYYPFNFDSAVDSSGNGNNGTIYNMTSVPDRFGKINSAYYFDGFSSYITVPDNQTLRLNNTSITLNAWVKLDAYNSSYGNNVLTKHYTGANNGWAWGITGQGYSTLGIVTYGPGGGSASARGNSVIGLNLWHMMTSVYNLSNQQLSIYVDGKLDNVTSNIPSPNASINAQLYIGRDDPSVPSNGYFIKGALDDIRIYNRALSVKDINSLYTLNH